jgi:DNA-directed RNA polymerase specialized sigma24 family protein
MRRSPTRRCGPGSTASSSGRRWQRLEPEFRQVFTLHAFERRSYKDIAAALDIPQNTVGTRLLRARKKLRVLLLGGREVET